MDKTEKHRRRIFSYKQKSKCWNNARPINGRDPRRWRYDALGNPVCNALRGCKGPLCHEYDHIHPYSKGGSTSVKNCEILQTQANRFKGNSFMSDFDIKENTFNIEITEEMMDMVEIATYGNINH